MSNFTFINNLSVGQVISNAGAIYHLYYFLLCLSYEHKFATMEMYYNTNLKR